MEYFNEIMKEDRKNYLLKILGNCNCIIFIFHFTMRTMLVIVLVVD